MLNCYRVHIFSFSSNFDYSSSILVYLLHTSGLGRKTKKNVQE